MAGGQFEAPLGGRYQLSSEREPVARPARNASGPSFSWCPAQPGPNIIGSAPTDAGFLVYHVDDTLVFFDQKGSHPSPSDQVQLQEAVTCHDMHWSAGGGGPELEAVIGLTSGEVMLWLPLSRREPWRGLSPAISPAIAGGGGRSILCVKWRPVASFPSPGAVCLAAAGAGGRISLFGRRAAAVTPPPSPPRRGGGRAATAKKGRGLFGLLGVLRASEAGAAVTALAFSPDGRKLAAVTADGLIAIYKLCGGSGRGGGAGGDDGAALHEGSLSQCSVSSLATAARLSVASGTSGAGGGGGAGGWGGGGGGGGGASPGVAVERVRLLFRLRSYFGGVLCVAWSGDGRCLVAGGEDDLISVVSVALGRVVARAQGHRSWVLDVAFQPTPAAKNSPGADARNSLAADTQNSLPPSPRSYCFASVGADGLLAFWDFSPPAGFHTGPHSPAVHTGPHSPAVHTGPDAGVNGSASDANGAPAADGAPGGAAAAPTPAPCFRAVPLLSPVVAAAVDPQPVSALLYGRAVLLVASTAGHLRTFARAG